MQTQCSQNFDHANGNSASGTNWNMNRSTDELFSLLDGIDFSSRASPAQRNYVAYLRSLSAGEYISAQSLPACYSSSDATEEIESLQQHLSTIPARQSQLVQLDRYGVFHQNPNCRHMLTSLDALRLIREIRKRKADSLNSGTSGSENSSQDRA